LLEYHYLYNKLLFFANETANFSVNLLQ